MQPGSGGADDDVDHIGADPQVESQQQEIFQQQQQQQNHPMLYQSDHHNQASMDEFLDNIISMPSWSEVGALRNQWDYNATAVFKTSLMSCQDASSNEHVGNVQFSSENDMLVVPFQNQLGVSIPAPLQNSELASLHGISDDMMVVQAHLPGSVGANVAPLPAVIARGGAAANLARSLSGGSSASEGSQQQQPVLDSQSPPAWCQQFVQALPLSLGGQSKLEGTTSDPTSVKKRYRDEEQGQLRDHRSTSLGREGAQVYGGAPQVGQMQVTSSQPSQQQSAPGQAYAGAGAATSNPATAGVARPRMRARRGQATDPHSIAERLRRERIAERMKALQELVPNANKTDKASMLDEIIDYVKFLQLQVKVLSMSRLGGAGAVAPLVADLPSEGAQSLLAATTLTRNSGAVPAVSQEGIALTERQVARLMEEDMGSAMQYLQSKGLCLMPISLATAISSTSSKASMLIAGTLQQATPICEDKLPVEAAVSGITSSMSLGIMPSAIGTGSITANGGNVKEKEKSYVTAAIESTLQTL